MENVDEEELGVDVPLVPEAEEAEAVVVVVVIRGLFPFSSMAFLSGVTVHLEDLFEDSSEDMAEDGLR